MAGLSAIGTARGMGAIVRVFDTRAAVEEQVFDTLACFSLRFVRRNLSGLNF